MASWGHAGLSQDPGTIGYVPDIRGNNRPCAGLDQITTVNFITALLQELL